MNKCLHINLCKYVARDAYIPHTQVYTVKRSCVRNCVGVPCVCVLVLQTNNYPDIPWRQTGPMHFDVLGSRRLFLKATVYWTSTALPHVANLCSYSRLASRISIRSLLLYHRLPQLQANHLFSNATVATIIIVSSSSNNNSAHHL